MDTVLIVALWQVNVQLAVLYTGQLIVPLFKADVLKALPVRSQPASQFVYPLLAFCTATNAAAV